MFPEIRVEPFDGPNLVELEPILASIPDPVEARWDASPKEFDLLTVLVGRKVVLFVKDVHALDRLIVHLGAPIVLDPGLITKGKSALAQQMATGWRELCEGLGHARSTLLLTKVVADSVRSGKTPKVVSVAKDVILKGVSPADADVLLRLKVWANKHP